MKRLLLIVLPLLLMVGCEDKKDDTTEPVDPLIGVYNLTSVSVSVTGITAQDYTLTFNHDGSNTYVVMILGDPDVYSFQGKIDGDITNEGGTWSDTGNKLTLIPSDGDTGIWDFTLSGNNLVMTLPGSVSYVYNFTKE